MGADSKGLQTIDSIKIEWNENRGSCYASSLSWLEGEFPKEFIVDFGSRGLEIFEKYDEDKYSDGTVWAVYYRSRSSIKVLTVFKD